MPEIAFCKILSAYICWYVCVKILSGQSNQAEIGHHYAAVSSYFRIVFIWFSSLLIVYLCHRWLQAAARNTAECERLLTAGADPTARNAVDLFGMMRLM